MKRLFLLASITLLGNMFVSAQPADGIYSLAPKPTAENIGPTITTQDGKQFFLGAKTEIVVEDASIYSRNNENTRFYLSLTIPIDENLSASQFLLVVNGTAFRQTGFGSAQGIESSVGFVVDEQQRAKEVAAFFKTEVVYRRHPKHNLLISFTPTKPVFAPGEEVFAKLTITNVGTNSVAFIKGGRNRGYRDNQYVFSARNADGFVPDIGSNMHFGGLAGSRTLKPGAVFEDTIGLNKWFAFDKAGGYEIHGSYFLGFIDPDLDSYRTIWEDWVTAEFSVVIKQ